jgi:hypothetical protein
MRAGAHRVAAAEALFGRAGARTVFVLAVAVAMMGLLDVLGHCFGSADAEAGEDGRAGLVLCELLVLELDFGEEDAAALVLAFPVLGAVEFPVLAEGGGEGFGEKEELDYVAARGEVFFVADYRTFVFVDIREARLGAFFGIR